MQISSAPTTCFFNHVQNPPLPYPTSRAALIKLGPIRANSNSGCQLCQTWLQLCRRKLPCSRMKHQKLRAGQVLSFSGFGPPKWVFVSSVSENMVPTPSFDQLERGVAFSWLSIGPQNGNHSLPSEGASGIYIGQPSAANISRAGAGV